MLMPWSTTTRPFASVIHRPACRSGSLGLADAGTDACTVGGATTANAAAQPTITSARLVILTIPMRQPIDGHRG
jgi:hypothetical protein